MQYTMQPHQLDIVHRPFRSHVRNCKHFRRYSPRRSSSGSNQGCRIHRFQMNEFRSLQFLVARFDKYIGWWYMPHCSNRIHCCRNRNFQMNAFHSFQLLSSRFGRCIGWGYRFHYSSNRRNFSDSIRCCRKHTVQINAIRSFQCLASRFDKCIKHRNCEN